MNVQRENCMTYAWLDMRTARLLPEAGVIRMTCPYCKCDVYEPDIYIPYKYCPWCGKDMETWRAGTGHTCGECAHYDRSGYSSDSGECLIKGKGDDPESPHYYDSDDRSCEDFMTIECVSEEMMI